MPINLKELYVLQDGLRHWDDINLMSQYVKNGGFWLKEYLENYSKTHNLGHAPQLISISCFEDGSKFIHDGLHRSVATLLGGRDYFRDDEFVLTDWKYSDYLEIVPEKNWFTPFDPRTHVRTADFFSFKKEAKNRFADNFEEAKKWLHENSTFKMARTIWTVDEFVVKFSFKMHT